jgi:aerobic C4-dicarboxylate transport protein
MSADNVGVVLQPPGSRRAWYRHLWVQVIIAMVVGVALGHFYPEIGKHMQPFGDGFIKLIKMLIAPIVFCTVVLGIAKMGDMSKVGKVASRSDAGGLIREQVPQRRRTRKAFHTF